MAMDKKNNPEKNDKTENAKRRKQLNNILAQLEKKREALNLLAEKEFTRSGDFSKIIFCEEQREFNRVSKDLAKILAEIRKSDDDAKPE